MNPSLTLYYMYYMYYISKAPLKPQSSSMVKTEQGKSFHFTILLDLDGQEQGRCILYCLKPFIRSISLSIKFISHKSNPTLNTSFEFSSGCRESVCELLKIKWIKKNLLTLNTAAITRLFPNTVARQAVYRDAARATLVIWGSSDSEREVLEVFATSSYGM